MCIRDSPPTYPPAHPLSLALSLPLAGSRAASDYLGEPSRGLGRAPILEVADEDGHVMRVGMW
eukprot:519376-Rhodomonas_salina.1